jgi:hypothetical protein
VITTVLVATLCACGHIKQSHGFDRKTTSPCATVACGCLHFRADRDVWERREVRRVPHGEGFDYRRKQVEA